MLRDNLKDLGIVVLAAGKGTRLGCTDIPKVMLKIAGRPIVSYIVEILEKIGLNQEQIVLVVGFRQEKVKDYFGNRVSYAVQVEQLGTANAVYTGSKSLPVSFKNILVLQGDDSAFLTVNTIKDFLRHHFENGSEFTLMTVQSDDKSLGTVIRDENGGLADVLEKEEISAEQKKIKERNTNIFIAEKKWIEDVFGRLEKIKEINEYGIPQFIPAARRELDRVEVYNLKKPDEFLGINTPEQLVGATQRMQTLTFNPGFPRLNRGNDNPTYI